MKVDAGAKAANPFDVAREAKLQPFLENLPLPGQNHVVDELVQRGFIERLSLAYMNVTVDPQYGRHSANQVNIAGPAGASAFKNPSERPPHE
jgi:hypothetical protein